MDLAVGLHRCGLHVEVATPRHGSGWSHQFTYRELIVHRPLQVFRSGWATRADRTPSRYIRDLTQWFIETAAAADVIVSDRAREEAIAAVDAARSLGIPSVVRLGGQGVGGDISFFRDHRMGGRCQQSALAADAVVVGTARVHRDWLIVGGEPSRVHRIQPSLVPIEATANQRPTLRHSLARVNGDLFVPDGTTVLLSVERMQRGSGLFRLVESALRLNRDVPKLQFWLVGDGPRRDAIYSQLRGDGLRQVTAMPGSFGSLDDIMVASDLMVHGGDEGFESQIPKAIMAALPLVIANTETAREFFGVSLEDVARRIEAGPASDLSTEVDCLHWFEPEHPVSLRNAVVKALADRDASQRMAESLRRHMQRRYPREETTDQYAKLFRSLIDDRSSRIGPRIAEASE